MATARPTFGAFNQGVIPTIACFKDKTAKTPLGVDLNALIAALQAYVNQHVAPVWGTPAKLIKSNGFIKDAWAVVFLDNADQPGALAYHDLTPDGLPLSKVFVRTTIDNGELVSVSTSHELVEMLVDPAINLMTTGPDPRIRTDSGLRRAAFCGRFTATYSPGDWIAQLTSSHRPDPSRS